MGAGSRGQAGAVVACGFITSVLPSQQVLRLLGFLVLLFLVGWPVLLHHGYHGHHVHLFLAAVLVSLPSLFLSASSCTQGIQLNHACLVANLSLVCGSAITAAFLRAFQYTSNSVPSLGRSLGIIAPSGHRQPLFLLVVLGLHSITPVLGIYGTLGRSGRAGASFCLLAWSVGGSWCWCRFLGARVLELVGTGVIGARILLGVFVCAALLSFGLSGRFLFVLCWFWCGAALCWASGFGRCVIWALGARRRAGVGRCSWALCRWGAWECWAWCVPVSPVS